LIGPLLLFTGIFFLGFLSRIIIGPLLPVMESDLGIGHATAGRFLLWMSWGYFSGLLLSSPLSSTRVNHHGTVVISSLGVALSLGLLFLCPSFSLLNLLFGLLGLFAGLYLPSGIATITALVPSRHWGKAIAVHELAPNLSFVVAPVMAELLLMLWKSWRGAMLIIGIASGIMGMLFAFLLGVRGPRGRGYDPKTLPLLRAPALWATAGLFSLGIGASMGIYTMLPLRLMEEGITRQAANALLSIARLSGLGISFAAGYLSDRIGPRRALALFLPATGMATIGLGLLSGFPLKIMVFLQSALSVCFFPAAFSALSQVFPEDVRNVAVSLSTPVGALLGAGLIPALIGSVGEQWNLATGMGATGVLLLAAPFLLRFLRTTP